MLLTDTHRVFMNSLKMAYPVSGIVTVIHLLSPKMFPSYGVNVSSVETVRLSIQSFNIHIAE